MSKLSDKPRFKCRWCSFVFLKAYQNRKGETCSGWSKVREHAIAEHWDELEKLGIGDGYLREDEDE